MATFYSSLIVYNIRNYKLFNLETKLSQALEIPSRMPLEAPCKHIAKIALQKPLGICIPQPHFQN